MSNYNNSELFSKLSNEWYLATALYDAIDDGNIREATVLIYEKHANPNVVIPDYGITPFHLSVGHENEYFAKEMTKILLKNGGNPNVRGNDDVTPLHVAAAWNRAAIVRLLLSYGADPLITDEMEKNAFHYAHEEKAWETLKTLEIHRRAETEKSEDEIEKSYKIQLDKIIIQSNDVQAEYKAPCLSCTKDVHVSKNTVGTQTPVPFVKILPAAESDESEVNFGTLNCYYDWCEKASNVIITNECKQKIMNHRVKSKTYEYNPIFEQHKFSGCNLDQHVPEFKKKYFPSASHENTDKSVLEENKSILNSAENSIKKETKYFKKNNEIKYINSQNLVQSKEERDFNNRNNINICEAKNDSFENLISEIVSSQTVDLNSLSKIMKETGFDDTENIPYIDESLSESSLKCDNKDIKKEVLKSNELNSIDNNSEKFHSVSSDVVLEPVQEKEHVKHVSWSGCLKTCACIPDSLNDSDTSVYYTNTNSDDDELKLRNEEKETSYINGIFELPETLYTEDCKDENSDYVEETEEELKAIMTETEFDSDNVPVKERNNISIEYKYTDDEDGIEFIEARLPLCNNNLNTKNELKTGYDVRKAGPEESELSDSGTCDSDYIRKELKKLGFVSGPMTGTTKKLYLRKLRRIKKTILSKDVTNFIMPSFSSELQQVLRDDFSNLKQVLHKWSNLEKEIRENFLNCSLSSSWRSGTAKTSFTYLLLDPRISNNLPARCEKMDLIEVWRIFASSIFYIGKGTRGRPYEHLHEAFLIWRETKSYPERRCSLKIRHILEIWQEGLGVVCLQVFHNLIQAEAYTREAAMIDAIGLLRLKNEKAGIYYGIAASWNSKLKRRLGTYLLYRAMRMFIADNEVQLRPTDIN